MCITCTCHRCQKVRDNIKNDLWYHSSLSTISLPLGQTDNLFNLFPLDKKTKESTGKPNNVIWCSAGTWIYNPYHEDYVCGGDLSITSNRCLLIKDIADANVLRIKTIEDLLVFGKTYGTSKIKWDIIRSNYDAVSIEFCKFYCISDDKKLWKKCDWQLNYDVESLMIFNKKAFNYEVVDIYI